MTYFFSESYEPIRERLVIDHKTEIFFDHTKSFTHTMNIGVYNCWVHREYNSLKKINAKNPPFWGIFLKLDSASRLAWRNGRRIIPYQLFLLFFSLFFLFFQFHQALHRDQLLLMDLLWQLHHQRWIFLHQLEQLREPS